MRKVNWEYAFDRLGFVFVVTFFVVGILIAIRALLGWLIF